ncbi:hypothetical protein [Streptomonospora wellingtoniae]|uniref:Minor tail protein n=1 Tax=Streptomonospora wellingtoniae TaxID=3075544 RepID=A0ABU2KUC4_9ACTN|nr:hypothetical protein [Streptomonospora sp. DSM 45055]MDT0302894.1 hypothetical protein [Streptomonospora sp. DSM 45055]
MTFQEAAFVDGGPINGTLLRRQYESSTRSGQGVVESTDLRVLELAVPADGFRITSGAAAIPGTVTAFDGSYYALNIGDHTVPGVAGTGSEGPRSDMVVASFNPSTMFIEPDIITDVDPDATAVPPSYLAGTAAIPLARIDWPVSTGTITQDMIVDLRQMLQERSERVLRVQRGIDPVEYLGNIQDPDWENAPDVVWPDVVIPAWATQVQVVAHWMNMGQFSADLAGGGGSTDARGRGRVALGYGTGGGPTDIQTDYIAYNFNLNTSNGERRSFGLADQQMIPAEMRGQLCNLRLQVSGTVGVRGRLACDEWSTFYVDLNFLERPAMDVT